MRLSNGIGVRCRNSEDNSETKCALSQLAAEILTAQLEALLAGVHERWTEPAKEVWMRVELREITK